jgi:hypothetical protein
LEALLWAGARIVDKYQIGRRAISATDSLPTVLFIGDSNIYGLHVKPSETIARQAEQLAGASFRSVNLGVPGTPSWIALERAREFIPRYRPIAVVVRVGINNRVLIEPPKVQWYDNLRLVRLARLLSARVVAPKALPNSAAQVVKGLARDTALPSFKIYSAGIAYRDQRVSPRLRADLEAIAKLAKEYGASTLFLSYFEGDNSFSGVNRDLSAAARSSGALFVDCAALGRRALTIVPRNEVLYADHHCTALGYALEARMLLRAMQAADLVRAASLAEPIQWLRNLPSRSHPPPAQIIVTGTSRAGQSLVKVQLESHDETDSQP